jgi:hypothetical protein
VEDGVLDQDPPDLVDALLVGERDRTRSGVPLEPVVAAPAETAELGHQRGGDLREVDRLHFHVQTACVEPREIEEVGGELGQALHLQPHLGEELPPRGVVHVLVRQQLDMAPEGEDRRP